MRQPKTIAHTGWKNCWGELVVVFGVTLFVSMTLLQMNLLVAMITAPFIMLALLLGVMLFVQLLWMLMLGLERMGSALGIRKSPLS